MKRKLSNLFHSLLHLVRRIQIRCYVFFHRSRKAPYPLYEDQRPPRRPRGLRPRIAVFLATLSLLTVLAMIYPLRPTYSDQERRDLTEFPSFSLSAVIDGSYFSDLSTWFADTFPLRDMFLSLQNKIEGLYGIQTLKITGSVTQGDEIPTVSDDTEAEETEEAAETDQSSDTAETGTDAATEEPTDTTDAADAAETADNTTDETAETGDSTADTTETGDDTGDSAETGDSADEGSGGETDSSEEDEEELAVPELDEDAVVEQLSAVLTIDNAGYEYYNFVQEYADDYTDALNRAADQLADTDTQVYSIIVPNSMGICVPTDVQEEANTSDQEAAIDYMNARLGDNITAVPVYYTLLKHYIDGDYLYFRTDHHWTALGAYRAYEQFAQAAGFTATSLDDLILHEYTGFLGTFYNSTQSSAMAATPDTVYAYESPSTNNIHITTTDTSDWLYLVIANVDNSSAANKYGTFIGGDNPYSYIENPNKDDGSAVMLVKESYGNAFAPFLIENYQYVYIVDYRYISQVDSRSLAEMCEDLGIDDLLFLNTISTTRASSLIEKLAAFIG